MSHSGCSHCTGELEIAEYCIRDVYLHYSQVSSKSSKCVARNPSSRSRRDAGAYYCDAARNCKVSPRRFSALHHHHRLPLPLTGSPARGTLATKPSPPICHPLCSTSQPESTHK